MAHLDEFGTAFDATFVLSVGNHSTTPLNIKDATVTYLFRKPSGVVVEKEATIYNARAGIARYIGESDFLDEPGVWEWQPKIETTSGQWFGQIERFTVNHHLIPS